MRKRPLHEATFENENVLEYNLLAHYAPGESNPEPTD